ncbi:hypothetical protein V500_02979, partial [Pseudogymnoascus sp. VKM F-4518 (FW-2643)]
MESGGLVYLFSNSTGSMGYAMLRPALSHLRPCLARALGLSNPNILGVNGFLNNSTTTAPTTILLPAMESGESTYLFPNCTGFMGYAMLHTALPHLRGFRGLCPWPTQPQLTGGSRNVERGVAEGMESRYRFQDNAAACLGEQNSRPDFKVKVMKMHWLSPISTKLAGSMVIYLDSWPVAQQMVAEGTILVGPTMGFPSTYIQRELPIRCYNCNQYGHMQGNCTKPAKCGNCSRAHQTRNCLGTEPEKCAACTGAHKVTDPRCTTFLKEVEKLRFKKSGRKEATTDTPIVPSHHYWEPILPHTRILGAYGKRFRSMIYVQKRESFQQIEIDSPDLTAVVLKRGSLRILCISAYTAQTSSPAESLTVLQTNIKLIEDTISKTRANHPDIQIVIGGDFNRHDTLWGKVASGRAGEGEPILQLILDYQLWSALPQGTITYHNNGNTHQSTIDLMLVPVGWRQTVQWCKTLPDHGSDHCPISLATQLIEDTPPKEYRFGSFNNADWEEIREALRDRLGPAPIPLNVAGLDQAASNLEATIQQILQETIPAAKPLPYSNRWWTQDLTQLRKRYHQARNKWTRAVKNGTFPIILQTLSVNSRNEYTYAIQKQKRTHWASFLDDSDNIWKALSYLKNSKHTRKLPTLQVGDRSLEEDTEKADALLNTFFPPQPIPTATYETEAIPEPRDWDPTLYRDLTLQETELAIFQSNPRKAPGPDDISFRVWQELWPVVQNHVLHLYRKSLTIGHLPALWAEAKIVVIPKPGKADYTIPKAYRPISLLRTISKGLERVIAQRLSEYLERNRLLANTQFGARAQRSTSHALMILQEETFQAWRQGNILSLVTFDVQGAYNGVNKDILRQRLQGMGIYGCFLRWIYSFCSNRKAQISFGNFNSAMAAIDEPGLPQGSPLSPILYVVYNSNLLRGAITPTYGDMGFVDDYTAWVIGPNLDENTSRLQEEFIPRITEWEKSSGATFEVQKTQFIHFGRNRANAQPWKPLYMNDRPIYPMGTAKILGVHLDQGLRMKEHHATCAQKAKAQAIALGSISGLRPAAMRQLYLATVASKIDYAAPIWFKTGEKNGIANKHYTAIQKLGSKAITGAYRTAAGPLLEIEAGLQYTSSRVRAKVRQFIVGLYTLPDHHPCRQMIQRMGRRALSTQRFKSPLTQALVEFHSILPQGETKMETIQPFVQVPKHFNSGITFCIYKDRELAAEEANLALEAV